MVKVQELLKVARERQKNGSDWVTIPAEELVELCQSWLGDGAPTININQGEF